MTLPSDDERTVLAANKAASAPGSSGAAGPGHMPVTGPATGAPADDGPHNALAVGTRLGEFEITGLLGEGGFGIVYLAYDSSLERHVALKEYMPSAFASRTLLSEVRVKSERHLETFQAGLRSFVNEARMLAQFDHPSLIKVYRFWEANGTAYMIMPYYQGITLKQALRERTAPADEAWLKSLLAPLLDTLTLIHDQQCFHRDIAPDNIMMIDEGQPVLLDFGAARRAISGMDQAFTVILKQGYAPIEQYAETPGMQQGAWTDLFALASVVHFAIDGKAPPPAVGRAISDPYVPLAQRYADRYSVAFLTAIDQALSVRPEERPQSAAEMRALLGLPPGATTYAPPASVRPPSPKPPPPPPLAAPMPAPAPHARKGMLIGGAVAGALAVAAGLGYLMMGKPARVNQAVLPAPAVAVAPPTAVQPVVVPVVHPGVAPPVAPPPATAASAPFNPLAAFQHVVAGASEQRSVGIDSGPRRLLIKRDRLAFSVTASHAGYLYVHLLGADPKTFVMLFPNRSDTRNRIKAGETIKLPRGFKLEMTGPAGQDHVLVIVSDVERDFSATGGVKGGDFLDFSPAGAARALQRYTGAAPVFAGVPVCPDPAQCSPLYGASMFSVEEYAN
ncbi:protein kinase domain-containing protein [Massilia sp. TWP1-3-3]|uniref:protein kinase domain-containing protein n=1 Tax=Massilia sp. TWP1-3-3 TaxID=2804573 RepID=UPI003CF0AE60